MTSPVAVLSALPSDEARARQLALPMAVPIAAPAEVPVCARRAQTLHVDHVVCLRARWAVTLRERFYDARVAEGAERKRYVVVAVPVPPGWGVEFGRPPILAYRCIGTLLTGHVAEGTVLGEFPLALLRESLERYLAAHETPAQGDTRLAA